MPPGEFVPAAEASGLIVPLGAWALREACRQAAAWRGQGLALTVAVNVSPVQLRHPDLLDVVDEALAASGLEPGRLELEVTEGLLVESDGGVAARLAGLAARGVGLAIDDFGTGYSSLAYLKRLPARKIKVDRSFVRDIGADPEHEAVVRAIVSLGHALGKEVVAEGVETEAQLAFLRALGCDAAQGFLLARPRPAAELDLGRLLAALSSRTGRPVPSPPASPPPPSGSRAVAVSPPPGRLASVSSPPWARTTERAMARPRPTPPVSREREPSRRTKGSNTRSSWSLGDARPVVLDRDHRLARLAPQAHARTAAVSDRVLDQVAQRAPQRQRPDARHQPRPGLDRDLAADLPQVLAHPLDQRREVDLARGLARRLVAREGERRLDHALHLVEGGEEALPGLVLLDQLGPQPQRRDRRPEVVAEGSQQAGAVVDEAAQPRLHGVEGPRRPPQLVRAPLRQRLDRLAAAEPVRRQRQRPAPAARSAAR